MTKCHDLSFVAHGSHFKACREVLAAHHPRVIPSHGDALWHTLEQVVVRKLRPFCCYSMKHVREVFQFSSEHLAYCLVSKTHSQYRFLSLVGLNHVEQQACLRRNAGTGAQHYLVVGLELVERELVVAYHRHVGTNFLYQVTQIISKRVVIVNDNYFHNYILLLHFFSH